MALAAATAIGVAVVLGLVAMLLATGPRTLARQAFLAADGVRIDYDAATGELRMVVGDAEVASLIGSTGGIAFLGVPPRPRADP